MDAPAEEPFDPDADGKLLWGDDFKLVRAASEALTGHHPERGGQEKEQAAFVVVQAVKEALSADEPSAAIEILRVKERTVAFIYMLMRDALPTGAVNSMVAQFAQAADKDFTFSSPELEALARRYAEALLGSGVAIMPKHMRDWIETFPDRIKSSHHFSDVLAEIEGKEPVNDRTKQYVIGEVVRRQRDEAKGRA